MGRDTRLPVLLAWRHGVLQPGRLNWDEWGPDVQRLAPPRQVFRQGHGGAEHLLSFRGGTSSLTAQREAATEGVLVASALPFQHGLAHHSLASLDPGGYRSNPGEMAWYNGVLVYW